MEARSRILSWTALAAAALVAAALWMDSGGDAQPESVKEPSHPITHRYGPEPAEALDEKDLRKEPRPILSGSRPVFSVEDRDSGAPIAGATLKLGSKPDSLLLGSTDDRGTLIGTWPEDGPPWHVMVSADGYLSQDFSWNGYSQHIRLEREGAILGKVTGAPIDDLAQGRIRVIAWDPWDCPEGWHATVGRPPDAKSPHAIAQSDGSFRVAGLERKRRYSVVAIGPSFGTPQPMAGIPTEGKSITLEGHPLHGAILRVTGPNGTTLRCSPEVVQNDPPQLTLLAEKSAIHVQDQDVCARLLRVSTHLFERNPNDRHFLFYLPLGDSPSLQLTLARPGYETWSGEVTIPPATAPLAEIPVVMQPWTSEFGSVEVDVRGLAEVAQRQRPHAGRPDAFLHLLATEHRVPPENRFLSLTASLPDLSRIPLHVGPLPAGDYVVSLEGCFVRRASLESERGEVVSVRASRNGTAEFDFSDLGTIQVSLLNRQGAFFGAAELLLHYQGQSTTWSFSGAPYRIPLLPEGDYEVSLPVIEQRGAIRALPPTPTIVYSSRLSQLVLELR